MMQEILTAVLGTLGAVGLAWAGWLFNRRSGRAEAKGKEIDNEVKLGDYYKKVLDEEIVRYESKFTELAAMWEKKFAQFQELHLSKETLLRDEIALLHRKNKLLIQENNTYRRRIKELEK